MVRSRSGVHVTELLVDLDFNLFFEKAWGLPRNTLNRTGAAKKIEDGQRGW